MNKHEDAITVLENEVSALIDKGEKEKSDRIAMSLGVLAADDEMYSFDLDEPKHEIVSAGTKSRKKFPAHREFVAWILKPYTERVIVKRHAMPDENTMVTSVVGTSFLPTAVLVWPYDVPDVSDEASTKVLEIIAGRDSQLTLAKGSKGIPVHALFQPRFTWSEFKEILKGEPAARALVPIILGKSELLLEEMSSMQENIILPTLDVDTRFSVTTNRAVAAMAVLGYRKAGVPGALV